MEISNYKPENGNPIPPCSLRSSKMERIALLLAIISFAASLCIYVSIITGALAMLFALLSRGGEYTMGKNAKIAFGVGLLGVLSTAVIYTYSFLTIYQEYGSFEALLQESCEQAGYDYDELMEELQLSE